MSKIFATFHTVYLVLVVFTGIASFGDTSVSVSISGILAPIIAWFGGSGLRGSFNVGDKKQKITGFIAGLVFLELRKGYAAGCFGRRAEMWESELPQRFPISVTTNVWSVI